MICNVKWFDLFLTKTIIKISEDMKISGELGFPGGTSSSPRLYKSTVPCGVSTQELSMSVKIVTNERLVMLVKIMTNVRDLLCW